MLKDLRVAAALELATVSDAASCAIDQDFRSRLENERSLSLLDLAVYGGHIEIAWPSVGA